MGFDATPPTGHELARQGLSRRDLAALPHQQLATWLAEARDLACPEWNAMTLATLGPGGRPRARIVLLKDQDQAGVRFFTNYEGAKARELAADPRASLVLFWPDLGRQVRIEGAVERLSDAESDAYFATRHRESQLGAWTSHQSRVLANRQELLDALERTKARFPGATPVPRPPHWGGFLLRPDLYEFWKSRDARLHDRFQFTLRAEGTWTIERLSP